jgi:hypothetical protein
LSGEGREGIIGDHLRGPHARAAVKACHQEVLSIDLTFDAIVRNPTYESLT